MLLILPSLALLCCIGSAWSTTEVSLEAGASFFMEDAADNNPLFAKLSPYKEKLADELDVVWDPTLHLQLEPPKTIVTLGELGYDDTIADQALTSVAYSTPFRLLSDKGVAALQHVLSHLEAFATSSERIPSMLRGGTLRSKFLRGLSTDATITAFVSRHFNVSVRPHTIVHQLGHVNFAPKEVGRAVDLWHVDNVPLDFVLFVTDVTKLDGGAFEVFRGTRDEATAIHEQNLKLPRSRVEQIKAPAGYAVMLQGHHVVHRAAPLHSSGQQRITFVNSFVSTAGDAPEASKPKILRAVDQESVVAAEWSVHRILRAQAQLDAFMQMIDYQRPTSFYLERLSAIRDDLNEAYELLLDTDVGEEHFGGSHDDNRAAENEEKTEL